MKRIAPTPTTREIFLALAPLVQPALFEECHRKDLCILTARLVLDVCAHFGVEAREQAVRVMLYNRQFAAHVASGAALEFTRDNWPTDGSHSVGVGFGMPQGRTNAWDGHLIVIGPGCFGDFAIQQAERLAKDIVTGPAVVNDYAGQSQWEVENDSGTTLGYACITNQRYLRAPDWRAHSRRRRLAGMLIRAVRSVL